MFRDFPEPMACRSGRKPAARVTNSARLFTPGEKDSTADSKVGVIVGLVVISLISKIWMFIRSGKGKNYQKIHVRKLRNCFTHYDAKHFFLRK